MGNVVDLARPAFGGPPRIPKDNSWTGITWDDFIRTRVAQNHISPDNGYVLCGFEVPEPVLETILSRVSDEDILQCNSVCRAWKDLITRKSFWKKCYERQGINWNKIPSQIREKPEGWIVLYSHFRYGTFSKNFIKNPSGHRAFDGWSIYTNGGDMWRVEDVPCGCHELPESSFFGPDTSCFVSSYQWCSKYYIVDLWNEGLNPTVMRISLPLQIKCSQMYATRFDCGGIFKWELRLLDSQEKIIREHKLYIERPPSTQWETAEYGFKFKLSHADFMQQIRYLVFIHEGRDSQFWKGHYGMKFARSCVTVECLENDPEEESELEADETGHEDSSSDYGHD
ncbi:F-box only protein 6 [Orchesella cincta]|uniref:F-box only protein 6 n=1 Tax=Orchesella cincta TaxID=48709 RepID=A0A1D2M3B8_ORCCI|nr:F-box only protein 6 [Orchesella cincta]